MSRALLSWGGWEGHRPAEYKEFVAAWMREWGFDVTVSNDLEDFVDADTLWRYDLIVPLWTLGKLTPAQETGLLEAVRRGTGFAGFHGTCGAFIESLRYKWMTGGQLVVHPGDSEASYDVHVVDGHEITAGLHDFHMERTEQYYMHVDPRIHVLATTTFDNGSVNPVAWTTTWGEGRVFYISVGHFPRDFDVAEPREMLRRGFLWASR